MPRQDKIKFLKRLGRSPVTEDRLFVASYSDTPIPILELLAGDMELSVRVAVRNHDNSPDEVIETIRKQYQIASDWHTKPEKLAQLGKSKWTWIRQAVARNPYTPQKTLAELAKDEFSKIPLAVARNYGTCTEVLDLLINHYDPEITKAIATYKP